MFNRFLPGSFKNQLIVILLVSTLVPALFVATILLQQIKQDSYEHLQSQMRISLERDSSYIQNRVTIVDSLLQQLALDQNNILAAENSVFSVYARTQLQRVKGIYPEILFLQIYDNNFWPAESIPFEFEFMSLESLFDRNIGLLPNDNQSAYKVFSDNELVGLIDEHADITLDNNQFLSIVVPLYKTNEANPADDIRTGFLLAVMPINNLLTGITNEDGQRLLDIVNIEKIDLNDNQETIVDTVPIDIKGQTIHLGIAFAREKLVEPVNRAFITIALITLGILAISIWVALYLSKRFTRPFENIQILIEGYRHGEFAAELPEFKFREFVQLAELLADMAAIIDKNQQDLEARVEARTEELAKANAELKSSLETQKSMQTQLVESEKMAQLGGLVAGISHEVNTPIGIGLTAASSMRIFVDELQVAIDSGQLTRKRMTELLSQCDECANILMSNLTRSADLISNFKEVAVSQSSTEVTSFNLKVFLGEIIASLRPQTKKYNLDITLNVEDLMLKSYQGTFAQIFTNFMMNSMRHGFEQEKPHHIVIGTSLSKKHISISYEDDGAGMTKANLDRIFEPFFTTKRGQGGTGLGMHIVYNLVTQKLNGEINIDSKLGEGTKIIIRLPISHLADQAEPVQASNL